jgi:hypothetical protein
MQFGLPIRPEDLIERLVKQLQAKCGLDSAAVFETLADDADHVEFPPADRFITLTPQRFVQVYWAGGGRNARAYDGVFRVASICRFASDQELRNTRELRDKTKAAVALNLKVLDCLSGFKMANDAGTGSYLKEPVENIDFDFRPKRIKQTPWSVIGSQWKVNFVMALPGGTTDPG